MTRTYDTRTHDIYFVSDTHFGHRAMADVWRTGRYPLTHFAGVLEKKDHMDEWMIEQWNLTVPPHGIVFHLGDVSFRNSTQTGRILDRLNGEVHLIPGNHDKGHVNVVQDWGWTVEPEYLEIDVDDQRIVMCHYAFRSWNKMHYGAWNLHGHSHGNLESRGKQLDVGVDCQLVGRFMAPLPYADVKEYMSRQVFEPVDHHTEKTNG